jgi:hypothetical protein
MLPSQWHRQKKAGAVSRYCFGEVEASNDDLKAMLRPAPPDQLQIWPVDRRVGNVKE